MNPTNFSSTSQESFNREPQKSVLQEEANLFTRHSGNPILSRQHWPYPVNSVFNAGVTRLVDGDTLLLCRVEDRTGLSHLCAARSANGIDGWRIDSQPTLVGNPKEYPEEIWGIEDPRITYVPELDKYVIAYTSFAQGGPGVSLALTKDFKSFERYGVIMQPEDKDAALLPRRIGGLWALIHRPMTTLGVHMWISYSPDLRHWGSHKVMLVARRGGCRFVTMGKDELTRWTTGCRTARFRERRSAADGRSARRGARERRRGGGRTARHRRGARAGGAQR